VYRIPSDEQVQQAIRSVLEKFRTVPSQHALHELILKELQTQKDQFGVSESRVRDLALKSGVVNIEIHSREGDPHKPLTRCPVCHHAVKRVKNLTIWGGEVTIEYRCPHCGYWTGKKKRIPTRYVFHLKT